MRLLIVDDNPGDVALLREAFADEDLAHEFVVAAKADDAERALEAQTFDLVVLDINLPGRSGLDLLEASPHLAETPCVVFSTSRASADWERAARAGAVVLAKPDRWNDYPTIVRAMRDAGRPTAPTVR